MNLPTPLARTRPPIAAIAVVFLVLCELAAHPLRAQARQQPMPLRLRAFTAWLAAVNTHQPGQADAAIGVTIASGLFDLEEALRDALILSRALESREGTDGASGQGGPAAQLGRKPIEFHGAQLTAPQVRSLLGFKDDEGVRDATNRLLRRAAVYHADVAIAGSRRTAGSASPPGGRPTLRIGDGQPLDASSSSIHWAFGREVLDQLQPGPSHDALARAWYNATASTLQGLRLISEADEHLSRAREIFPDDAEILFRGACAVEAFTSPSVQSALELEPVPKAEEPGSRIARDVRQRTPLRSLLERAEDLFRRALQRDPSLVEARIRLARLTADRGRHAEALDLLSRPLPPSADDVLRYLAWMLLGDQEMAAGRRTEARAHYEAAANLFPTAQTSPLALGLLARESGDAAERAAALDRLSRLPADLGERVDPWWFYYLMQGGDAGPLTRKVYAMLSEDAR